MCEILRFLYYLQRLDAAYTRTGQTVTGYEIAQPEAVLKEPLTFIFYLIALPFVRGWCDAFS
jgi:hypothetical protein